MEVEVGYAPIPNVFEEKGEAKICECDNLQGSCLLTPIQSQLWSHFYKQQDQHFLTLQDKNQELENELKSLRNKLNENHKKIKTNDEVNNELIRNLDNQNSELGRLKHQLECLVIKNDNIKNENKFLDSQIKCINKEWEKKINQLSYEKEKVKTFWSTQLEKAIYENELKVHDLTQEVGRCHLIINHQFNKSEASSKEIHKVEIKDASDPLNNYQEYIKYEMNKTLDTSFLDKLDSNSHKILELDCCLNKSSSKSPNNTDSDSIDPFYREELKPSIWEPNMIALKEKFYLNNEESGSNSLKPLSLKQELNQISIPNELTDLKKGCSMVEFCLDKGITRSENDAPNVPFQIDCEGILDRNIDQHPEDITQDSPAQSLLNPNFNVSGYEPENRNTIFKVVKCISNGFLCMRRKKILLPL